MTRFLFTVQEMGSFFKGYPGWLLAGNGFFVTAGLALIVYHLHPRRIYDIGGPANGSAVLANNTAKLWVICPLAILMAMHALVLWVAVAGIDFR
jgi:hypothetical protein